MSGEFIQLNNLQTAKRLVGWLLAKSYLHSAIDLDQIWALPLNDGGMGSLFLQKGEQTTQQRQFGRVAAEITFVDSDGTPVSAALMLDQKEDLLELNIFKADFSPVITIPEALPNS